MITGNSIDFEESCAGKRRGKYTNCSKTLTEITDTDYREAKPLTSVNNTKDMTTSAAYISHTDTPTGLSTLSLLLNQRNLIKVSISRET